MGTRRKARECALQMLFAADVAKTSGSVLTESYWDELGEPTLDEQTRHFADNLTNGTLAQIEAIDDRIRTRAEHWRIERMAIVDRNILRLSVMNFSLTKRPQLLSSMRLWKLPAVFQLLKPRNLSTEF